GAAGPQAAGPTPVDFAAQVVPALSKAGCNAGACHGTPSGKNGFRLSLRGYLPDQDYLSLTRDAQGRRLDRVRPEASLILLKGTGTIPHEGGRRFTPGSYLYRLVRDWIAEGAPPAAPETPALARLEVVPARAVLDPTVSRQRLAVSARFTDG